ncbi:MAG: acyltransferase [Thermoplasmatales archaeon]|nr:acyltransferase [Thermoplasmatales archaeon]
MDDNLALMNKLRQLHYRLREQTKEKYNRVNPFNENLFDWKEKGDFCGSKNTTIYDSATIIGDVKIGNNVWIGPFCMIDGSGGLSVGDYCDISAGVKIFTHDTVKRALSGGKCNVEHAPVSIGKCCFIGTGAIILKGVKIGDHCLIAANSLVNESFPNNSIIAGISAKNIGEVIIENNKVQLNFKRKKSH